MGSDLLTNLHRWDDGQRIIEEMNLVVFRRKGYEEEEKDLEQHPNFPQNEPIVVGADQSLIGVISSTEIRRRVLQNAAGQKPKPNFGVAGLVTSSVIQYINSNQLYQRALQ